MASNAVGPEAWLFLPQLRMTHEVLIAKARAAEQAGFEGVALIDHMAPPGLTSGDFFDAMTTAAVLLASTTTLRVNHLVLCNQFRHPALLAKEVATLDQLSGGRFELGIGWGSVPAELAQFGFAAEDSATRSARLAESLPIIKALLTGEPLDHDGRFYQLTGAQQRPAALGAGVPITIGGGGPKLTMPLVRDYADWWNLPTYAVDRFDELAPLAGDAKVSVQVAVGLAGGAADVDAVRETAQRRFGGWGSLITGTPDEVAEGLRTYVDRRTERFYLQFSDFGDEATLNRYAESVRPLLV